MGLRYCFQNRIQPPLTVSVYGAARLLCLTLLHLSSLCGLSSDCLEIVAEFDPGDAEQVGLRLRCAPDGREQTVIA